MNLFTIKPGCKAIVEKSVECQLSCSWPKTSGKYCTQGHGGSQGKGCERTGWLTLICVGLNGRLSAWIGPQ